MECILKALVLEATVAKDRLLVLSSFRGGTGHDFEWLRNTYRARGGQGFPKEINRHFTLVSGWSIDLRYSPRTIRDAEAAAFMDAAATIIKFADGRL